MKISIIQSEYKRIEKTVEVSIPEKQMYLWHNGIRRAYSVKPVWSTWNVEHKNKPEEIIELSVVMVDPSDNKFELVSLSVTALANIAADSKHPYQRLVDNILNYPDDKEYFRTKEQFEADFNKVIDNIKESVGIK
jgi:hypothetical protein